MRGQKEKISTAPELFAAIDRSIYADAAALASRYHEYVREAIIAADAKMQQVQDARTKATVAFRKQCAQVGQQMREAFRTYKEEVAAGTFPAAEHTFKMDETVLNKLY